MGYKSKKINTIPAKNNNVRTPFIAPDPKEGFVYVVCIIEDCQVSADSKCFLSVNKIVLKMLPPPPI